MPDTKFSFASLREHLRKFLWIYIIGVAACLVLTSLLWTTTRPQIPADRKIIIFMADSYSAPEALTELSEQLLAQTRAIDDTIESLEFERMQFSDPQTDYTGSMVLMTRLAVGDADIMLASPDAMNALVTSGAAGPLDEAYANGWMADSGLEPYYATVTDEEAGTSTTFLAGMKLDNVTALGERGIFNNQGAYLAIVPGGQNEETSLKVAEFMIEALMEDSHVSTEGNEPAA